MPNELQGFNKFIRSKVGIAVGIVFVLLVIGLLSSKKETPPVAQISTTNSFNTNTVQQNTNVTVASKATVTEVVDGDTVKLADGTTIRVVGIDTPETKDPRKPIQCFGQEASKKMQALVEGKEVNLEENPGDTVDKYGRQLRYLALNGVDVGAALVREGYAFAYRPYPHQRMDTYIKLEREARQAKRGLWAESSCNGNVNTSTTIVNTNTTVAPANTNTTKTNTNTVNSNTGDVPAPACSCPSADMDCSDFSTSAAAQAVYDCCLKLKGSDVHRLDRDKDGLACESN